MFTVQCSMHLQNMKNGDKSRDEVAGREEENFIVNASPVSEHPEASPEGYPDIIDIAGMDYSPARRKPPIHNWEYCRGTRKKARRKSLE